MSKIMTLIIVAFVSACSSNIDPSKMNGKANTCATPGATYLLHFTEEVIKGNCGKVPDTFVSINTNGTISVSPL